VACAVARSRSSVETRALGWPATSAWLVDGVLVDGVDLALDDREPIALTARGRGVRDDLLPEAGQGLQVRLRLFRQLPDVRFLGAAETRFDLQHPHLAGGQLRVDERRRVIRPLRPDLRAFLDEDRRQPVGDPLRKLGLLIRVVDDERVEAPRLVGRGHRLRHRDRDAASQLRHPAGDLRLGGAFGPGNAGENGHAQQLLLNRAHALLVVEWRRLTDQAWRHERGRHSNRRRRLVLAREVLDEKPPDERRRQNRCEPQPAAAPDY
jgi:hypothetical protein